MVSQRILIPLSEVWSFYPLPSFISVKCYQVAWCVWGAAVKVQILVRRPVYYHLSSVGRVQRYERWSRGFESLRWYQERLLCLKCIGLILLIIQKVKVLKIWVKLWSSLKTYVTFINVSLLLCVVNTQTVLVFLVWAILLQITTGRKEEFNNGVYGLTVMTQDCDPWNVSSTL